MLLVVDPKHVVCRGLFVKDIISLLYHSSDSMLVMSLFSLEKSHFIHAEPVEVIISSL